LLVEYDNGQTDQLNRRLTAHVHARHAVEAHPALHGPLQRVGHVGASLGHGVYIGQSQAGNV
jgi:hypothetical protein